MLGEGARWRSGDLDIASLPALVEASSKGSKGKYNRQFYFGDFAINDSIIEHRLIFAVYLMEKNQRFILPNINRICSVHGVQEEGIWLDDELIIQIQQGKRRPKGICSLWRYVS